MTTCIISLADFVAAHREHNSRWPLEATQRSDGQWSLTCTCGHGWVGTSKDSGESYRLASEPRSRNG